MNVFGGNRKMISPREWEKNVKRGIRVGGATPKEMKRIEMLAKEPMTDKGSVYDKHAGIDEAEAHELAETLEKDASTLGISQRAANAAKNAIEREFK